MEMMEKAEYITSEVEDMVVLRNIVKRFGKVVASDHVNIEIKRNEFFSLLGPSGSGKTTLLRIIAGLEKPDEGVVILEGKDVTNLPPYKRNIGMVFQHLALFPHMTVFENIAYGLRLRKFPEDEIKKRVYDALELVKMPPETFAERKPSQLSGGQQQRVAIARALVTQPAVLLLDEPLGALDLKIRQHMMLELKRIQRTVGTTFVYVTHDQGEALVMSDRIAVIHEGRVEQVGTPYEVYEKPRTKFVANFIGEANFFEGVLRDGTVETSFGPVKVVSDIPSGRKVVVSLRPERIRVGKTAEGAENRFDGRVREIVYKGDVLIVMVALDDIEVKVNVPATHPEARKLREGEIITIGWDSGDEAGVFELEAE